ncbi:tripartite tricarboxylate transporter TctB family protein [Ammoniphilus resinae]|uniref:Chromate transport protein ChrA n=1 Tax=Ammoniphilus resinae TaxID=861532 RepID=A0ABS4GQY5_9BACL|nr:tripartite tricarboxylate transporter TctB family protein [Ammoniphilus resinae]MBP1932687.1 chromate transport protein ChrA [Ammoniphilus resinae]
MKTAEQIASFIVMILAVAVYAMTLQFPSLEGFETGPAFFPKMLSIVFFILGVLLFLQSFRSSNDKLPEKMRDALIIMVLMLVYLYLVTLLGFNISTPIILVIFLAFLKVRTWYSYIALPIGVTFFVYLIFQVFLGVPIPEGAMFG